MNLSAITNKLSDMSGLDWVALSLALVSVIWLAKSLVLNLLKRNGHLKVEINGKEVLEVEAEGQEIGDISANKNTKEPTSEEEKKQEKKPTEDINWTTALVKCLVCTHR